MRREESVEVPLKGLYLEIWKDRRLEKEAVPGGGSRKKRLKGPPDVI